MSDRPSNHARRLHPAVVHMAVWLVAVLGVLPFRSVLFHYPWKVDAVKWVVRGATDDPTWTDWVFAKTHFVGYRPVAAVTYSIGYAIDGYGPEIHRGTDIALQVLAVVCVARLFTRLVGRVDPWAIVVAALFAAHPVAEEIVPFLARRSYSLSTVLLTAGLAWWLDGLRRDQVLSPPTLAGSLAILAALLTNETSYVALPLLPMLVVWKRQASLRKALEWCIPVFSGAVGAVVLRFAVMGWAGGYDKRYLAVAGNGKKALERVDDFFLHRIIGAAFEYTWLPVSMMGDANPLRAEWSARDLLESLPPTDITVAVQTLLFALVAYYTWHLAFARSNTRDDRFAHGILLAWMFGCSLLYGISSTWFWRQGYPMAVPLVLVLTWHLRATVHAGAPWRLVPQAVFLAALLWHSPVIRGMSTEKLEARIEANRLLQAIDRGLLPEERHHSAVLLIAPGRGNNVATLRRWLMRLHPNRTTKWRVLASGLPIDRLVEDLDDRVLVLSPHARLDRASERAFRLDGRRIPLERLEGAGRRVYLVYPDADGEWQATTLKSR